jgi:uncharacterized protein
VTTLMVATECGRKDIVKALLKAHADASRATHSSGVTALHIAAYKNDTEVARLLLEGLSNRLLTGDVNAALTKPKGVTPLFLSCFRGNVAMAKLLVTEGKADLEEGTSQVGVTPLFCAAEKGYRELVRILIAERHKRDARHPAGSPTNPPSQTAASPQARGDPPQPVSK